MIEVYVPFLLILMSWNAEDPDASMRIQTRLFLDQAACESYGENVAVIAAADRESRLLRWPDMQEKIAQERFSWKCIEAPKHIQKSDSSS